MVISIRRSRHEEGEELVAIWCRSVDATHDFLSALSMAPELTTNVNEQNEQAVGFYKKVGFKVTGRSEVDDLGKPYPLLNLAYVGV